MTFILALTALLPHRASGCEITVKSLYTSAGKLNADQTSYLGADQTVGEDRYGIAAIVEVKGNASQPYKIRFEMADRVSETTCEDLTPGTYSYFKSFPMPTDGPIRARIVVDSEHRSGDESPEDNRREITFVPKPPAEAIQYYDAKHHAAHQSVRVTWSNARPTDLDLYIPVPTDGLSQRVVPTAIHESAKLEIAEPHAQPVFHIKLPVTEDSAIFERTFNVEARSVRSNRTLVDAAPWADAAALSDEARAYLASENTIPVDHDSIAKFVTAVVPRDFRSKLSPAQAARKIFIAVAKTLSYVKGEESCPNAIAALESGRANCQGMSELFVASCRKIGIPARTVSGWWKQQGVVGMHTWTEIYLENVGWLPEDVTSCNSMKPTGDTAYYFGLIPDLNQRLIMTKSSTFKLNSTSTVRELPAHWLQIAWTGVAPKVTVLDTCRLVSP